MFTISCPPKVIWLGRKGENEFRTIEVEASEWLRDYPNGTVSVVYHRPDGAIYMPTVTTSGNVTSWIVTATDTAIAGKGEVEYRITDGDVIGKSIKMPTMVSAAINATTDAPAPPPEDWAATAANLQGQIGDLDALETEAKTSLVDAVNELAQGGGGGTSDHRQLSNRDAADSHPMSAITGLVAALNGKQTAGDYATSGELDALADIVDGKADAADIPTKTSELTNDSGFLTQHQSLAGYATEQYVNNHHDNTKQDVIADLATIRSGAALGATALQDAPSNGKTYGRKNGAWSEVISGGGGGTSDHTQLANRDAANQHPMSAITGLEYEFSLINNALVDISDGLGTKLSDAPSDGKQYARKNGAWAEVQGGGGGAAIFEITVTEQSGSFTYSPTFAEIQAAITAGKVVVVNDNGQQYQYYWQTTNLIHFERVFEDDGLIFRRRIDIYNNGTADVDTYQLNVPMVNDAVLTIKQGGVTKGTFSANASSATEINLDAGGGGGATVWGGITGTLNNQTDLKNALDGKQNAITDLAAIRSGAALGATALQSVPNTYRTASAQDVIDSGFVKLVGTAGQTIQTNVAVPLNVKNNIVLQHRAFVGFQTHDDNAIGFIGVDGGKPTFLAADGVTAKALQGETITDTAGYYTSDTVEGALAEIGGTLDGLEDAINTIRGVS